MNVTEEYDPEKLRNWIDNFITIFRENYETERKADIYK